MSKLYTVQELVALSTTYLKGKGCQSPRLDAEVLMAHVLNSDRVHLYMNLDRPLEKGEVDAYRRLIGLRGRRTPVAYLTGSKEFYGLEFVVSEAVLIPRPETELLVGEALAMLESISNPRVFDLGTGSGVIAVTVAFHHKQASVLAVDISEAALEIARTNADRLQVADQLSFLQSDMFSRIPCEKFDLICANLPYIPSCDLENLDQEVRQEPIKALDGGQDGLDYYRILIEHAPGYLTAGGCALLEIGEGQRDTIVDLAAKRGYSQCLVKQDYAGKDRVVVLRWQ
ncbi:MAG: peptide chain release factor N(5)-glutamine methyltransferase [Firmicutes bacterium]|jgi:release factor glutamine methyltransferase|nr:peptide chain release factor N(5)-glutamine methyltransferase [Bacillota bacterium]NLL87928.1 peptide chain release factor N(5)-glutamine methyltransferase [Bacillota bacterium]HKM16811.1 peptide chain release factor N(5)-glutamine methyltransferase [Limnochordia bacterium]